jgi:hypothetical protein
LHHKSYDSALVTFNRKYEIVPSQQKMDDLTKIGYDGGMKKFIADLKPLINVPPDTKDRPHIAYVSTANKIRGWKIE